MDSDWWEWQSDLANDIHDTLKCKENSLERLKGQSKLLYWRRYLVDWLALTCQKYKLNLNAQHLAVCLYDRFTDQFDLDPNDVRMLVLCCLLISSKFEEREENIPKFKTLVQQLQWKLDASEYLQMEIRILSAFKWQIAFPTAVHFKEYYMQYALNSRDVFSDQPLPSQKDAMLYVEKNVNYFLEISLQDHAFLVFKPSLITSACIAATRVCLRISPTWTRSLEEITKFSWQHLAPCIEILLKMYEDDRRSTQKASTPLPVPHGELEADRVAHIHSPAVSLPTTSTTLGAFRAPTLPRNNYFRNGFLV